MAKLSPIIIHEGEKKRNCLILEQKYQRNKTQTIMNKVAAIKEK